MLEIAQLRGGSELHGEQRGRYGCARSRAGGTELHALYAENAIIALVISLSAAAVGRQK